MLNFKKCVFVDDLLGITLYLFLIYIFILVPPFNETFIRIPIIMPLFFFIPGYSFIAALFPGKGDLKGIERITLSIAFSLIIIVFDGFLISLLQLGFYPDSIVTSILGVTTFFNIIAIFTRKLLNESDQFSFSFNEFIQSVKLNEINENEKKLEIVTSEKEEGSHGSPGKIQGLKFWLAREAKKISLLPELEKGLIIGFVISIILVSGMQVYAKFTHEEDKFTALYILDPDGKAENYPTESLRNIPVNLTVGIENHEHQDVNYVLQMKADGEVIEELNISMKDGGTWQKNMTYTRQTFKIGRSKIEFALFKDKPDYFPYRSVHLYIENNNNLTQVNTREYNEVPLIENGYMESSTEWDFTSNTDKIIGSYVNGSGINSSYAYEIMNSYKGNLSDSEYGRISQNIECKEKTSVMLSAYVKSVSNSSSQGTDNQIIQITVNGGSIWTEGISGNGEWQHLVVPIDLQAGGNNLTFGLEQTPGEIRHVEVFWDSISLKSTTDIKNITHTGIVESIPPSSSVLMLPNYTTTPTFTASWSGTDNISGIAYYSIDSSTDGITWETWIPKTTNNSAAFTGENNKTYFFRSKAIDNVGNEEPVHQRADTQTKVFSETPQVKLDISPNPCKNATTFTVTYPLPLKAVICSVTPNDFGPESVELKSIDNFTWTGNYKVKYGKHFYVEAICTDINGSQLSVLDEFTVDKSMPDFLIQISPKTIDVGDLEIKVIPSTALKNKPSVSVSANKTVNITYMSYLGGTYYYKANIEQDINEGEHTVSVTGYGLDGTEIKDKRTFVVSHPKIDEQV